MKPFVTSEPDVVDYPITSNDWFLVIASDGIWDALSNEQVASMTMSYSCTVKGKSLRVDAKNLRWTSKRICEHARFVHQVNICIQYLFNRN